MRIFWISLLSGAMAFAAAVQPLNTVVAVVNGEAVTKLAVERLAKQLAAENSSLSPKAIKQRALDDLIDQRVLLAHARLAGIDISDAALKSRLSEIRKGADFTAAQMKIHIRQTYGFSEQQFGEYVRERMAIQALFYRDVYLNTQVSEAELEQFLMAETAAGIKRQYRFGFVLIARAEGDDKAAMLSKLKLAEDLRLRLLSGDDFTSIARAYSDDKEYADGDLGFRTEKALPAVFAELAHSLKVGEVADIVETTRGFLLIKLLDESGGEMREKIVRVRLSHVFLPLNDPVAARALADDIAADKLSFVEAVRRYSTDDISVPKGGDLGWFGEEEIPDYFVDAVDTLPIGTSSQPIESPFGWHILQVSERTADEIDLAVLRDRAERFLRERRAQSQRAIWVKRLRATSSVRILDPDYLPDNS